MNRSRWIRPLDALRALRRVRRDPQDEQAVFAALDALDGPFLEGWFRRFGATRVGRRVFEEERDLLALLADRAWLATLPAGSVGRAYLDFVGDETLSPGELVAATGTGAGPSLETWLDGARVRFSERLRDQHELEHVVTGYGRDLLGEIALLAFSLGQAISLGPAVLVGLRLVDLSAGERQVVVGAYRRGRRAAWLPATDWEALLELPLADVRALLSLGEPPVYQPAGQTRRRAAA